MCHIINFGPMYIGGVKANVYTMDMDPEGLAQDISVTFRI